MSENVDDEPAIGEQTTERSDTADAAISILISVGAIFLLARSQQYAGVRSGSSDPGAAVWPQVILLVLLLASVVNLINIYRRNDAVADLFRVGSVAETVSLGGGISNLAPETKQYVLAIVVTAGYLLVLTELGFLVSTAIFLALFVWILGYRSAAKMAVFSVVVSVLVFVLFRNFMNIALPYGTGIFRELGIFVESLI